MATFSVTPARLSKQIDIMHTRALPALNQAPESFDKSDTWQSVSRA
jgi:hypothetical protein